MSALGPGQAPSSWGVSPSGSGNSLAALRVGHTLTGAAKFLAGSAVGFAAVVALGVWFLTR